MATTSILGHVVPCVLCGELREMTDNGDDTWTIELCSCGGGVVEVESLIIDPDVATAKPPWDKLVGGWL